jgi:hypothetical protein
MSELSKKRKNKAVPSLHTSYYLDIMPWSALFDSMDIDRYNSREFMVVVNDGVYQRHLYPSSALGFRIFLSDIDHLTEVHVADYRAESNINGKGRKQELDDEITARKIKEESKAAEEDIKNGVPEESRRRVTTLPPRDAGTSRVLVYDIDVNPEDIATWRQTPFTKEECVTVAAVQAIALCCAHAKFFHSDPALRETQVVMSGNRGMHVWTHVHTHTLNQRQYYIDAVLKRVPSILQDVAAECQESLALLQISAETALSKIFLDYHAVLQAGHMIRLPFSLNPKNNYCIAMPLSREEVALFDMKQMSVYLAAKDETFQQTYARLGVHIEEGLRAWTSFTEKKHLKREDSFVFRLSSSPSDCVN